MNLNETIKTLNRLSGETLSITFYSTWELTSYGENSLFSSGGRVGSIRGRTPEECVRKAVDAAHGEKS